MNYELYPLGDQAIIIEFGNEINLDVYKGVQTVTNLIECIQPDWLVELIPSFTTVTLFYNPLFFIKNHLSNVLPYEALCHEIQKLLAGVVVIETSEPRTVEIPVCYGGELGPDLAFVAQHNKLTEEDVIHIHSRGNYIVYMLGFAPGFPYIGGMSEEIATPRRTSPRLKIPPRSVGIAGGQTGIYPIETPGGWQLIGKTPLQLFRVSDDPPTLLQAGDKVCFKPITYEEFCYLEEKEK